MAISGMVYSWFSLTKQRRIAEGVGTPGRLRWGRFQESSHCGLFGAKNQRFCWCWVFTIQFQEYVSSHSYEYVWMIKLTYSTWLNGWYFHDYVSLTSHLAHVFRQWPSMFSVLGELLWFSPQSAGNSSGGWSSWGGAGSVHSRFFPDVLGVWHVVYSWSKETEAFPNMTEYVLFIYVHVFQFPVLQPTYSIYLSMFSMM